MRNPCLIFLTISILAVFSVYSQQPDDQALLRDGFGIFGNLNFNAYDANFRTLPGVPTCCPRFLSGDGYGLSAGLLYQHPLTEIFFLTIRGGYYNSDGALISDEKSPRTILNINGQPIQGVFRHKISASISSFGVEPLIGLKIWDGLSILGGLHAGYVIKKEYEQDEAILEPAIGTFENNKRSRLASSGELKGSRDYEISFLAGVTYDLPLSKDSTWYIQPEAFYKHGLTPVMNHNDFNGDWSINSFRVGIALKYFPKKEPEKKYIPPVIAVPKKELRADIHAYGLYPDSTEKPVAQLKVEEFLSTKLTPLLTYLFFDETSSRIPDRYIKLTKEQASRFSVNQLRDSGTIEAYHHLLNIIGYRLRENPQAMIILDGCNSNSGMEKNNLSLSLKRANALKKYIVDTWEINPDRIKVSERNLPQDPSNNDEREGLEENRRVEIYSTSFDVVAPLIFDDTIRQVTPPVIRFRNEYSGTELPGSWLLSAISNGSLLKRFQGKYKVPEILDWVFGLEDKTIPRADNFDYRLVVSDRSGMEYATPSKNLPVEQVTIQRKRRDKMADKFIDRFSLILFQFDKAHLSVINQKIIDIVKSRIKSNSTVTIKGHTDALGTEEHNKQLSQDRAVSVSELFESNFIQVFGEGETELLYDNSLPEGRFYCRRVDIIVETPIEE